MKLYQVSWLSGILSFIILGVLRRSAEISFEILGLVTLFLVILPTGIGTILSAISWKRKEVNVWWIIVIAGLNVATLLAGILHFLPD